VKTANKKRKTDNAAERIKKAGTKASKLVRLGHDTLVSAGMVAARTAGGEVLEKTVKKLTLGSKQDGPLLGVIAYLDATKMPKVVNGKKAGKDEFVRVALELIQAASNNLPDLPETDGAQYVVHTYHTAQCDSQR
jgi:hypothetical protein